MNRILWEIASILFLVTAFAYAAIAVGRGVPAAWLLFVAPCLIYGVITIAQRLPLAALNLTVTVTHENASRIEPVVRDFLASTKGFTMMLVVWVNAFAATRVSMSLFLLIEGVVLVSIFAQVFGFLGRVKKLA